MSDLVAAAGVPEVAIGSGVSGQTQSVPPTFSGKWEDFGKDMEAIAAEHGGSQPAQPAISQPPAAATQPPAQAQPQVSQGSAPQTPQNPPAAQAQPAIPEVPEKFRTPDGKLDENKLLNSYLEAERSLSRTRNQLQQTAQQPQAQPQTQVPQPQPQAQPQAQSQYSPFELQIAQELINEAAAAGQALPQAHALATARVQVRLMEAKHRADTAATFSRVQELEQTLQDNARKSELQSLAQNPQTSWVLTPQGQAELIKARQENPHLNQSNEPWRAAALHVLGQRALYGMSQPGAVPGQVTMPSPTATQQQAPPLPAMAAPRTSAPPVNLNSPAEVAAYVSKLTPDQEAEFWKLNGFKWEAPRKQYMGI